MLGLLHAVGLMAAELPSSGARGWGVDACLTAHVDATERASYLRLLGDSGVGVLREREPKASMGDLKTAGQRVVAFVQLPGLRPTQPGNALPENLRAVYDAARAMARANAGVVDAWEMVGEPDVGYCPDLPDRLAAYQKALYLGIKAGAMEASLAGEDPSPETPQYMTHGGRTHPAGWPASLRFPLVLMGALALPPGPWLARAMLNDLLDYTDAYNFHFYGLADDLTGVIAAHQWVAKRATATTRQRAMTALPLWITECGLNAVTAEDFMNPARRALQAEFTVSTARQALAAPAVAVFMPFILTHRGDPHALTLGGELPLPAWTAYARFTREHSWPARPLGAVPVAPNPVVVQWLPDNTTTVPHKVAGTYRFTGDQPIRGAIRIFNFSAAAKRGRWRAGNVAGVRFLGPTDAEITIPAQGEVSLPVEFWRQRATEYFRSEWAANFTEEAGVRSRVSFGLEAWPRADDFDSEALRLQPPGAAGIKHPLQPEFVTGDRVGVWSTMNGLRLRAAGEDAHATRLRAWVTAVDKDPLRPTMAVAALRGLPAEGFLRVVLDRPMDKDAKIRVDLVDRAGQRFTVWENLGVSYLRPGPEVWLNFRDFGVYFWGRCTERPDFRADQVEEIQLRIYLGKADVPMNVALSIMRPKSR